MMDEKEISPAKKRYLLHKRQGKEFGGFDIDLQVERTVSSDEYYNIKLLKEEEDNLLSQYVCLNKNLEKEFYSRTQLGCRDIAFFLLATALQCCRQYLLTDFKDRVGHEHTKKNDQKLNRQIHSIMGDGKDGLGQQGGYYFSSLDSIILDGVPYDMIAGSAKLDLSMCGMDHRYKTLGHDPILGWVFGPLNIMTNTLTRYDISSYHIRASRIFSNAKTEKVFNAGLERLKSEPVAFVASVAKQAIHFNSDIYTAKSLPVPFIQTLSPEYAEKLANYGVDAANILTVSKQVAYATMINTLISVIHSMFFKSNREVDMKLHQVKTRKIILYSNLVATGSNMVAVALTKDLKKMDIGGAIVTIYRIVKDEKFIRQVMQEFIDSEISDKYARELDELSFEYNQIKTQLGY